MNQPKKTKIAALEKDKKPKLVRDSFTIPKDEYAAIDALKARALSQCLAIKKSELLRAGLMALAAMSDASFKDALAAVPTLKTGRPSSKGEAGTAEQAAAPASEIAVAETAAAEIAKPARKTRRSRASATGA